MPSIDQQKRINMYFKQHCARFFDFSSRWDMRGSLCNGRCASPNLCIAFLRRDLELWWMFPGGEDTIRAVLKEMPEFLMRLGITVTADPEVEAFVRKEEFDPQHQGIT